MAYIDPTTVSAANLSGQLPGLGASLASIVAGLNASVGAVASITTTGQNIDVTSGITELAVSGTMAGTLPNGTFVGQRVRVRCLSAASSPAYTLTVTTPETATGFACSSTFIFNTAGQEVTFEWASTSKWRAVDVKRCGSQAATIGTTVLTGLNLCSNYALTMTGTNASTSGGKNMPNGSAIGEQVCLLVASSGGTTGATLGVVGAKADGTAGTTLTFSSATATADTACFRWDGQLWIPVVLAASAVMS